MKLHSHQIMLIYKQKPKAIKSFGIRISPLLEAANIKPQNIEKHFTPNIPAWCIPYGKKSISVNNFREQLANTLRLFCDVSFSHAN